jgi:hypothetical protein
MAKYLKSVAYRASFFSMPDFKSLYLSSFVKAFPNVPYKERKLTQYECQEIDVDTLAADLDIPLVDLMNQKVYVFEDVKVANRMAKVYVCHYYIYIYIKLNGEKPGENEINDDIIRILGKKVLGNVQVQRMSCIVNHTIDILAKEFNSSKILDFQAFPQIYPEEIRTGRYSDSHEEDKGYIITLIRDITKGQTDDNEDDSLNISITSIVDSDNYNFGNMYLNALTESARCFIGKESNE